MQPPSNILHFMPLAGLHLSRYFRPEVVEAIDKWLAVENMPLRRKENVMQALRTMAANIRRVEV
jgi:hypothetical protein